MPPCARHIPPAARGSCYTYPLLPEGRVSTLLGTYRGGRKPPRSLQISRHRAPERALHELLGRGFVFRSQTVVARRRPSEVRRHSCSTLLDTLPPSCVEKCDEATHRSAGVPRAICHRQQHAPLITGCLRSAYSPEAVGCVADAASISLPHAQCCR